jgi:hypothetical protein
MSAKRRPKVQSPREQDLSPDHRADAQILAEVTNRPTSLSDNMHLLLASQNCPDRVVEALIEMQNRITALEAGRGAADRAATAIATAQEKST